MKKIIGIFSIAALAVTVFMNTNINNDSNTDLVSLIAMNTANAESGGSVTCYSESRAKSGATYYDCGDCTKQFNSKGYGSSSTCTTS